MVVTRKTPLPPTPSSRSSSSQTVPRMPKVKANQFNQPEHSSPLANGKSKSDESMDYIGTPKLRAKSKWRRKSSPKAKKGVLRRSVGFIFKIYLAWLAAYWLFVCQNSDHSSGSSICHTISTTHSNVLEPYAYPLIKRALSHPTVEPYVKEIEPYVIGVHHVLQPVAATAISKFSTHVIPEWNKRVVPGYYTYIAPYTETALVYLNPYVALVETQYKRHFAQYVNIGAATAWKLQEKAQPYVIVVWHKSVDGYKYAKPYARPAWEQFKNTLLRFLAYLAVYRRRFVDPHVAQMWAKIKELSGDKVVPTTTKPAVTPESVPAPDTPSEEPSTVAAIFEKDTHPPVPASPPIPPPVLSNDENLSPDAPLVTTVTPEAINILGGGPTDPVEITIPVEPGVIPPQEQEHEPQTPNVADSPTQESVSITASVDETPAPTPAQAPKQTSPDPSVTLEDGGDLESFSAEIGLDADESEDALIEETQSTPSQESDEEREARLKAKAEETAWKRKEITDRHTNWEYQLEDLKREQMEIFKLALYNLRKTGAKMLKKESSVQRAIDMFAADGERYLKGAESYLKNLVKEKKQDKGTLWERVIQKVEDKFEKRLDDVDRKVGDWYNELAGNERAMVEKATTPVADLAQKAQVDLGLDYSWLDDVTVEDWVRYHDLMRSSDSFHEDVLMVRNGTHPESLDNPVFRALKELRVEVDDIITGFKSRLRRIQRDGERAFDAGEHEEEPSQSESAEDSPVSILPIASEDSIPPVTIGKSPEQIVEALKEAPLEDWATSKQKKPDGVHTHEEL